MPSVSRNWKSAELRYTLRSRAMAGLSCTPREEVEMMGSGDPEFPSALVGLSGLREGLGVSPLPPSAWVGHSSRW